MGGDILVDGYNVIKNNLMYQMLETKNLAVAREVLIKQLKNRYRHTAYRVVVVFDGNGNHEQISHDEHICIIFSRYGETADRVIARLAARARAAGQAVLLYSNDGEVKQSVIEQGGRARTAQQLNTQLNAAPRDIAIRARHRQEMRRIYGLDPSYKPDDDLDEDPYAPRKKAHHRKKKKRAARRSR